MIGAVGQPRETPLAGWTSCAARDLLVVEVTSEAVVAARARLSELVPLDASLEGITTEVHAVEAEEAWQAIVQAAERYETKRRAARGTAHVAPAPHGCCQRNTAAAA